MHSLCYRVIFQRGNANEPVSAHKRKRALEFGAYSSDYCALQRCGLVIVQLIYGAAPLRSAFALQQPLLFGVAASMRTCRDAADFPSSCR